MPLLCPRSHQVKLVRHEAAGHTATPLQQPTQEPPGGVAISTRLQQDVDDLAILGSYRAAHRTVMPSVIHDTRRYANNLAEASHQPTRQASAPCAASSSRTQAQRFLTVYGVVRNLVLHG